MATSSRGRVRRTKNEINMVPFIDVMLVLLIIFMVTAPLITPSQIELPSVGQASAPPKTFVQVVVNKDELIRVSEGHASQEGQTVTIQQLAAQVQQLQAAAGENSPVPVVISADKSIKYETVVKVMDTLQRAGVERVGLSVQASR
ncbi:MAG: biopolymer transporter ExbD [Hydrogenophaga sp.]|jgi:biopolymer transport protein TolR|uniref:biopolymer transporter ExbD n=1 Tax=Hydrogenophaga sp. TaxID=1904254 RepID=UPI000EE278D8|nr:biopolymer transporter ExbD [Hydrogenophaga sp.]MDD3785891.1 biopolymer transporter ExbD [Hydrogenophaga sp.]MDX9969876.1 biopolymer transporter ExbD [Hydrogenophaga sp.]HAJ11613.1 protein TolR [Comamonadaceae bacterium]